MGPRQSSPSPGEWRELLQEVKVLYLRRRYKQCAARVTELLREANGKLHALYLSFLHYYAAASYENLGHIAHNFSTNKLPLLYMAKDCYASCNEALDIAFEEFEERNRLNIRFHEESDAFSQTSTCLRYSVNTDDASVYSQRLWNVADPNSKRDESDGEAVSPASNEDTPSHDAPFYCSSDQDDGDDNTQTSGEENLMPPPLRIQKTQAEYPQPLNLSKVKQHKHTSRPLPEPPMNAKASYQNCSPPLKPEAALGLADNFIPLPPASLCSDADDDHDYTRVISLIASLSHQVSSNVDRVCEVIEKTVELQRIHKTTRNHRMASFWSFTPVFENKNNINNRNLNSVSGSSSGSARSGSSTNTRSTGRTTIDDDKRQRIEKLRAEGWRTVGIRSPELGWKGAQYYEQLCSVALAELYGY